MYRGTTYNNHYPLTQNPSIALVKTAAVGGTGKVGDYYVYFCCNWNTNNPNK
jgi:hypothetical protein